MSKSRNLATALEMTPDKLAFIGGGSKPATPENRLPVPTKQEWRPPEAPRVSEHRNRRPVETLPGLRLPITTKLSPGTVESLRRASLERRLRGVEPSSVQDIVEEAIGAWLDAHV